LALQLGFGFEHFDKVLRGIQSVLGTEVDSGAIAGIAGLGHIMLSLALGLLLIILGIKIWAKAEKS
jgi:hypothetical protein